MISESRARDPANIDRMMSREDKMNSRTKYKVTKIHMYDSSRGLMRHYEVTNSKSTKF